MKIGLIRHFKVNHPFPDKIFVSKSEVVKWFAEYDRTENLQCKPVDLKDIEWQQCYSSTMPRAIITASHIYKGEIVKVPELQELSVLHRLPNNIKLPFFIWGLVARMKAMSSNKDTVEFKNKIAAFVKQLIENNAGDVLIVSHWFVMRIIRQELINNGFVGDDIKSDEYGVLYVYERGST